MSTANTISTQASDAPQEPVIEQKTPWLHISHQSTSPQSTSLRNTSPNPNHSIRPPNSRHTSVLAEEFFTHPRDIERHSKLPYFIRVSGSITPKMVVPLLFVAIWATLISCISHFWYPLIANSVLLTVLGFVVGLGISFRTSSAYERYVEGRKYWSQLNQVSRDLARHIWIHTSERHDVSADQGKEDLLGKLTALNLINAFAVALRHRLRFQPYTDHADLQGLVSHLQTFAGDASKEAEAAQKEKSVMKRAGEYLGLTFAESNPRKLLKRSKKNLGNLPLEILTYLSAYIQSTIQNQTFDNGAFQGTVAGNLLSMNEVLAGTERVLNTPLPEAYAIAISQITWVYVLALPFQLWEPLKWITIPGTVIGAYIILGIAAIGREIEDPFGEDVNDLPLEKFCSQIANEINIITAKPPPTPEDFIKSDNNQILYSLGYGAWKAKSTSEIRATLKARAQERTRSAEPADLRKRAWGRGWSR